MCGFVTKMPILFTGFDIFFQETVIVGSVVIRYDYEIQIVS